MLCLIQVISFRKALPIPVILISLTFLSVSDLARINADNIICTDTSFCIATNTSNIMIGDNFSNNNMFGLNGTDVIVGSKGNNTLGGGERMNEIIGGAGNDIITGGDGSDVIMGGTGNDNISGGSGADEIMGGEGHDTIYGNEGPDAIMGGPSNDAIVGGMGSDSMNGREGNDKIYQGAFNSTASDGSQDIIYCGDGDDEVWVNLDIDKDQSSGDCEIIYKD